MKNMLVLVLTVLLALLPTAAQTKPKSQLQSIVFTHVTVIDMTGAPAKPDMTVVTMGSHIFALGKTGRVRVPRGATVVDGTGKVSFRN